MRTVFLTGATGFIGWKLSGMLSQQGSKVLTLVRKSNPKLPQGFMPVLADLENPESVAEAVARCDIVSDLLNRLTNHESDRAIEQRIQTPDTSHGSDRRRNIDVSMFSLCGANNGLPLEISSRLHLDLALHTWCRLTYSHL